MGRRAGDSGLPHERGHLRTLEQVEGDDDGSELEELADQCLPREAQSAERCQVESDPTLPGAVAPTLARGDSRAWTRRASRERRVDGALRWPGWLTESSPVETPSGSPATLCGRA